MTATVRSLHPLPPTATADGETDSRSEVGPSVDVQRSGGVIVLRPRGALDAAAISALDERVRDCVEPVVLDLDECVLVDPGALERVVARAGALAGEMCVASRRLSCRRLLSRVGLAERVAVFACVADALQARVLEAAGYGHGWSPR